MELISVSQARVGWLFDFGEYNPQGKDLLDDLISWLTEAYSFEKYPKSVTELDPEKKSLSFKIGRFQVKEEIFITVELDIYSDGIVANSWSSTEDTEAFLDHVMGNAAKEFHLNYHPDIVQNKTFVSEVTVRCDRPLAAVNPRLISIADRIGTLAGRNFEFGGMTFSFDTRVYPVNSIGTFRIERKHHSPLNSNRYFSSAPLRTKDHLAVLQDLQSILSESEKKISSP